MEVDRDVVLYSDVAEFARLARPLLAADPVRHTSVSTVLHGVEAGAFDPAAMLTMHENGRIVGALLRTAGQPALVSAVPPRCAAAVVDTLLRRGLDPVGAQGPREEVEAFAAAWTARTGTSAELGMRMRLFALTELRPPAGVPGSARALDPDDEAGIDFLAAWRQAFDAELAPTWPHPPTTRDDLARALIAGGGELLWEVDGEPVAQAAARAVVAGMSRIGPVYTPPEHRGHGYAAAVTAAAARWALERGARQVLLTKSSHRPTSSAWCAGAVGWNSRGRARLRRRRRPGRHRNNQEGRRRTPVDQVEHAARQYAARWSRIAGVDLWLSQPVSSGEDPPIRGEAGT